MSTPILKFGFLTTVRTIGDSWEKVIENVLTAAQKLRLAGIELNSSKYELAIFGHQNITEVTRTTDLFQEILPDV